MTIGTKQLASGVARQVTEMAEGIKVETPWPEGVSVLYVGCNPETSLPFDTMALTVASLDLSRVVDERFARPSGFVATFVGGALTEPPTVAIDSEDGTVTVTLPALPYLASPHAYWQDASGAYVSAERAAEADRALRELLQAALDRREKVIGSLGPLAQVVADDETDPALLALARSLRQFGTRLDLYTVADDARALRALAQKSS